MSQTGSTLTRNSQIQKTENVGENKKQAIQEHNNPLQSLHLAPVVRQCFIKSKFLFKHYK